MAEDFVPMTLKEVQNRPVKLKGVKLTQTMQVRRISDDRIMTINIKHFNDSVYEDVPKGKEKAALAQSAAEDDSAKNAARAAELAVVAAERVTPFNKRELSEMSREALTKVPEWSRIPARKRDKAKDKDAMIDLVIGARK